MTTTSQTLSGPFFKKPNNPVSSSGRSTTSSSSRASSDSLPSEEPLQEELTQIPETQFDMDGKEIYIYS